MLGKNLIQSQRTSFGAKLVQDTESTMAASERVSTRNPVALTTISASIFDASGKQGRDSRGCGRCSRSHTTSGVVHDDGCHGKNEWNTEEWDVFYIPVSAVCWC